MMPIKLINFTTLSPEQSELILTWRNDENTRRWMYTSDPISTEQHCQFLKSLDTLQDRLYFLIEYQEVPVGVIYLTQLDLVNRSAHIGLYKNPFLDMHGIGTILLQTLLSYAYESLKLQKVYAECFTNNLKALKLYDKFNFKSYSKISHHDQILVLKHTDQ